MLRGDQCQVSLSPQPVITRDLRSKNFLKKQKADVKRYKVRLDTLGKSEAGPAAIVKLQMSSTRHNFAAVYLSDMLSPLLGDRFYSYRARPLMGHMTRISHRNSPHAFTSSAPPLQTLPDWMLLALGLPASKTALLPKHLHLARTHLPGYLVREGPGGSRDLTVYAEPPEFFMRTAEALKIEVGLSVCEHLTF